MRKQLIVVVAALALVCASTALAGGWATVKLSSSPVRRRAVGRRHHGAPARTRESAALLPEPDGHDPKVAAARSASSSSAVSKTFRARSTGRIGVYRARVVFPSAGKWRYEVFDGFTEYGGARTHKFAPVKVAPSDT